MTEKPTSDNEPSEYQDYFVNAGENDKNLQNEDAKYDEDAIQDATEDASNDALIDALNDGPEDVPETKNTPKVISWTSSQGPIREPKPIQNRF